MIAKGKKGFLLKSFDGKFTFRTYDIDGNFKDYRIVHHDLEVTIDSDDAQFYFESTNGLDGFIDYTPDVLGYKD